MNPKDKNRKENYAKTYYNQIVKKRVIKNLKSGKKRKTLYTV